MKKGDLKTMDFRKQASAFRKQMGYSEDPELDRIFLANKINQAKAKLIQDIEDSALSQTEKESLKARAESAYRDIQEFYENTISFMTWLDSPKGEKRLQEIYGNMNLIDLLDSPEGRERLQGICDSLLAEFHL